MKEIANEQQATLSLRDLLIDAENNALSDYLSLSLSRSGNDARISVTTTGAEPTVYSAVYADVHAADLQSLLAHLQTDMGQG